MKREMIYCLAIGFVGAVMLFGAIGHMFGNSVTGSFLGAGVASVIISIVAFSSYSMEKR